MVKVLIKGYLVLNYFKTFDLFFRETYKESSENQPMRKLRLFFSFLLCVRGDDEERVHVRLANGSPIIGLLKSKLVPL